MYCLFSPVDAILSNRICLFCHLFLLFANFSSSLQTFSPATALSFFSDSMPVDIKWHVSSRVWLSHFVINSSYLMLGMTGWFPEWLHSLSGYAVFQNDFLSDFIFLVTVFHWLIFFNLFINWWTHRVFPIPGHFFELQ